jgi:glycosyltransferase involved in cell wall biosynthesis
VLLAGFNTSPLFSPAPVVLVAHSVNAYSDLPIAWSRYMVLRHAGLRWLGRRSAAVARRVVFVSRTSAEVMAPKMGVAPARVRIVHYGWRPPFGAVDAAVVPSTLPSRYILTVGDVLEHKNVETLLDAFDVLVDETGYAGGLVIVGGMDSASVYGRHLQQRHRQLRHAGRVHFVGRIPYPEIAAVYRRADLFALPSLEETFGLPLVEAMGAGVPVVASDWRLNAAGERGRTNVGPEICGTVAEFFDPEDARSLVAAMRRVFEAPARRSQLAADGPARAGEFSWRRAADGLLTVLDEAAAQK